MTVGQQQVLNGPSEPVEDLNRRIGRFFQDFLENWETLGIRLPKGGM